MGQRPLSRLLPGCAAVTVDDLFDPRRIDGLPLTREIYRGVVSRRTGSGPPLILFHGGRGCWNHWIRNIGPLAAHFTVYAIDLPGFGCSMRVPRDLPVDDYVDLVVEGVAAIMGQTPFRLAGFSFGGMTAASVAQRMGSQVARLSLLAPAGWGGDRLAGNLRSLKGAVTAEDRRAVHRHNLGISLLADPRNVTEESVTLQTYNIESASYDSASVSGHSRLFPALADYAGPLQLIMGTVDIVQAPSVEWRIAKMIETFPRIRIDRLEGAAHWAQYDRPEAFNTALISFMRDDPA